MSPWLVPLADIVVGLIELTVGVAPCVVAQASFEYAESPAALYALTR